jgi:hypothetical protein
MKKVLPFALLCLGSVAASASPILTTPRLITELMAHDASANSSMMALFFGADFGALVPFTSHVDPANLSYSFSSQPGSTYLGQSVTVSGSGVFDSNTGVLTTTSSGMLGSTLWTTGGTLSVSRGVAGYTFTGVENFISVPGGILPPTRCVTFTFTGAQLNDDGTSVAVATWMNECNNTSGTATQADTFEVSGHYLVITLLSGEVHSIDLTDEGDSPEEGGDGDYTISFASVPEPDSLLLLSGGLAIMTRKLMKM